MIELAVELIGQGLIIGSGYALIAVGLTMIFGLMNVANFAHGEFYMLGAYFAFTAVTFLRLNYFVAVAIAIAATMLLGFVLDRLVFRRLRREPIMSATMATIGLAILLQYLAQMIWGAYPLSIRSPFPPEPLALGPVVVPVNRLFIIAVTIIVIALFHWLLTSTRLGKAIRATFQNKESAALVGIDIERIYTTAFTIGAGLAAISGALLGSIFTLLPTMGGFATLKAFIVVIVGGMGSFLGAIVSGLLLGVAEALGAGFVASDYKDAVGFVVVIIVLLFAPHGLFGRKS
ncbi:MAG: branched-chain amino acid ABC transporter permease [Dehalococcoidia bacterium]|nr:branched-chain amino acid ABC transporter permease [Dehalococcoidia bacterium]